MEVKRTATKKIMKVDPGVGSCKKFTAMKLKNEKFCV
jgi:hypothetical protein